MVGTNPGMVHLFLMSEPQPSPSLIPVNTQSSTYFKPRYSTRSSLFHL